MRKGFTLIELLVVIAIIAILAAILFPVFARARAKAQQSNCLSNVKQIMLGWQMYMSDYDTCLPGWNEYTIGGGAGSAMLSGLLMPYVKNGQIFFCPGNGIVQRNYAGWPAPWGQAPPWSEYCCDVIDNNIAHKKQDLFGYPAEMAIVFDMRKDASSDSFFDCRYGFVSVAGTNRLPGADNQAPHSAGLNAGFLDGHAKYMTVATGLTMQDPTTGLPVTTAQRHFWWGVD
ncbi:MAG TPA: prepilin-type N-terminal cleavage/methylation domain-containing protein [Armatimonadota bacterium]